MKRGRRLLKGLAGKRLDLKAPQRMRVSSFDMRDWRRIRYSLGCAFKLCWQNISECTWVGWTTEDHRIRPLAPSLHRSYVDARVSRQHTHRRTASTPERTLITSPPDPTATLLHFHFPKRTLTLLPRKRAALNTYNSPLPKSGSIPSKGRAFLLFSSAKPHEFRWPAPERTRSALNGPI